MNTKHSDPLAKCGDDEPVFVLRANDEIAPLIVMTWATEAEAKGCDKTKVDGARAIAGQMLVWQARNGCKKPD